MYRRLRFQISKRHNLLIFINQLGRNLLLCDLAKIQSAIINTSLIGWD